MVGAPCARKRHPDTRRAARDLVQQGGWEGASRGSTGQEGVMGLQHHRGLCRWIRALWRTVHHCGACARARPSLLPNHCEHPPQLRISAVAQADVLCQVHLRPAGGVHLRGQTTGQRIFCSGEAALPGSSGGRQAGGDLVRICIVICMESLLGSILLFCESSRDPEGF